MKAEAVVTLWRLFEAHGLEVCIDGGWAVDALLERQTRAHGDLDIALPASQVPTLRKVLAERGFEEMPSADSWKHNFVLREPGGAMLDVHSYELNPDGTNRLGVAYIAEHLTGEGRILGQRVRCVPPDWLVRFHTGYDIDADDWQDVRRLCARFGLPVPDDYAGFAARDPES